jgi:hypothetical protein
MLRSIKFYVKYKRSIIKLNSHLQQGVTHTHTQEDEILPNIRLPETAVLQVTIGSLCSAVQCSADLLAVIPQLLASSQIQCGHSDSGQGNENWECIHPENASRP